jgi:hypothetical protein
MADDERPGTPGESRGGHAKGGVAVHIGAYSPSACGAFNSVGRGGMPHRGESKQPEQTSRLATAIVGETTVMQQR